MSTGLICKRSLYRAFAALVAFLFLGLVTLPSFAQVYSASLEELSKASTAIVVGKATSQRSFWTNDRSQIFTEVTLRVDETVAGNAATETVITIPGGRVGNAVYEVSDMPIFLAGEEVVVFLWQDASGRNLVTGGSQGRIGIDVDDQIQRRVVVNAPPLTRQVTIADDAGVNRTASDEAASQSEVLLLDQLVKRIKEVRER
jgi:hypothetical protein